MKNRTTATLIICSLFFAFFTGACSYKKVEFDTKSGKTNTVKVGEKFVINLIENHEKNFYWLMKENSNKLSVDYQGSSFHGDKSGEVSFVFKAMQAGEAEFKFTLNHYNDSTDSKVFKVKVIE